MIQTPHRIHFRSGRWSHKELADGVAVAGPSGRWPRVTKLMALAIRVDKLIRDGHEAVQAEPARLSHAAGTRLMQKWPAEGWRFAEATERPTLNRNLAAVKIWACARAAKALLLE